MRLFCFVSFLLIHSTYSTTNLVDMGCSRNPNLPYCKAQGARTERREVRGSDDITEHDKLACKELREEYTQKCGKATAKGDGEPEFCQAFENICFRVHKNDPDQITVGKSRVQSELEEFNEKEEPSPSPSPSPPPEEQPHSAPTARKGGRKKKINFTQFCKEFKTRYLYICPDPFRFGQKAVLFCPIYSEHCHVPLPDRPVVPERKSRKNGNSVQRLCASYRNFAENYCSNALLLAQPKYREGCEKYWRFCLKRG